MRCLVFYFVIGLILYSSTFSSKLRNKILGEPGCSIFKPAYTPVKINTVPTNEKITSAFCVESSGKDLEKRVKIPDYYSACKLKDTWGPWPKLYDNASKPKGCSKEKWARNRILKAIQIIIDQGWNYCHHHSPHWLPPKDKTAAGYTYRRLLNGANIAQGHDSGVCSNGYLPGANLLQAVNNNKVWTGIDCSHFSSYTYNLSFGAFLDTNVHLQACERTPESLKVSAFLPYNRDQQEKFLPGDLLYIARNDKSADLSISHVILWTGFKMGDHDKFSKDNLLKNVEPEKRVSYGKAIDRNIKAGRPVYVIADSHYKGPAYRPFVNWYYNSFSHARRAIGKESFNSPDQYYPKGGSLVNKKCTTTNINYIPK